MEKLSPFSKKVFATYSIIIALTLFCAIYFSLTIEMFELSNWNRFVFDKSAGFAIPAALAATLIVTKKINRSSYSISNEANVRKGKIMIFAIALIINLAIALAAAHMIIKSYNINGASQEQVVVEGNIVAAYYMKGVKSKRRRKRTITVFDIAQKREIKFSVKKKYEINTYFKDTLTKGSLGFLYKKQ